MWKSAIVALVCLVCPPSALAADSVLGVFVVDGRTTALKYVYVTLDTDPDGDEQFQTILVSSIPIAPADRNPARLNALAGQGHLKALRIIWRSGADSVLAVPYDNTIPDSGFAVRESPSLNFMRLDDRRIEVRIRSKMIGQLWHYDMTIKADYKQGGVLETEPMAAAPTPRALPPGGPVDDERRMKLQLGTMGFEFTDDSFGRSIVDANPDALELFLKLGKNPNVRDRDERSFLTRAISFCDSRPGEKRTAVILSLIGAGADVNSRDNSDITALLEAVHYHCDIEVVRALLKAGADPNAKSRGGSTPLFWATYDKNDALIALLKNAGARE